MPVGTARQNNPADFEDELSQVSQQDTAALSEAEELERMYAADMQTQAQQERQSRIQAVAQQAKAAATDAVKDELSKAGKKLLKRILVKGAERLGASAASSAIASALPWILAIIAIIAAIIGVIFLFIMAADYQCNESGWFDSKMVRLASSGAKIIGAVPVDICEEIAKLKGSTTASSVASGTPVVASPNADAVARSLLATYGITVNNPCNESDENLPNQTCLSYTRQTTLDEVIRFKQSCDAWIGISDPTRKCEVVVTGASELGHANGTCSHRNGFKVDLRTTQYVNQYIQTNPSAFKTAGTVEGYPAWDSVYSNALYVREGNPDHWDVSVNCG